MKIQIKLKAYIIYFFLLMSFCTISNAQVSIDFSLERGYYNASFSLALTSIDPTAIIRYTTNGETPSQTVGSVYSGPITINTTTVVKAIAYTALELTKVEAHTYIFINDVINQPSTTPNFPTATGLSSSIKDDNTYGPLLDDALQAIPFVSISLDITDYNFIYTSKGISRQAYVEFYDLASGDTYGRPVGVSTYGNTSFTASNANKKNYRLRFKEEFGASKFKYDIFGRGAADEYDVFDLRAGSQSTIDRGGVQNIHEKFMKDLQIQTSGEGVHGRFLHVFINGVYWGVYTGSERPAKAFGEAYFGGDKDDYNTIKATCCNTNELAIDGTITSYNQMKNAVSNYPAVEANLDIDNFIDYVMICNYGPHGDWRTWNTYALDNPTAGVPFKFFIWDVEPSLKNDWYYTDQIVNTVDHESIWQPLKANLDFRMRVSDHFECNCEEPDGPLNPTNAEAYYDELFQANKLAYLAETARWANKTLYDEFLDYRDDLISTSWFSNRMASMKSAYESENLYPSIDAVNFSQDGGIVNAGFQVSLSNPNSTGTIYYTLDGADPRAAGGTLSSAAMVYSGSITLAPGVYTIAARVKNGSEWSAMCPKRFYVDQQYQDLVINEIHYNPYDVEVLYDVVNPCVNGQIAIEENFSNTLGDFELVSGIFTTPNPTYEVAVLNAQHVSLTVGGVNSTVVTDMSYGVSTTFTNGALGDVGLEIHYTMNVAVGYDPGEYSEVRVEVDGNLISFNGNPYLSRIEEGAPETTGPQMINLTIPNLSVGNHTLEIGIYNNQKTAASESSELIVDYVSISAGCTAGVTQVTDTISGKNFEFIELKNCGSTPINLVDLAFTKGITLNIDTHLILGPDQFAVFGDDREWFQYLYGFFPDGEYIGKLDNGGENIWFVDPASAILDSLRYNDKDPWPATADKGYYSMGLKECSTDNAVPTNWSIQSVFTTPKAENIFTNFGSHGFSGVVINEIHYNPADSIIPNVSPPDTINGRKFEFIEIKNISAAPINLSNALFTRGVEYEFPDGTILNPGDFIVIAEDKSSFQDRYGFAPFDKYDGQLSNSGETIWLNDSNGVLLDALTYDDSFPWDTQADGGLADYSLALINGDVDNNTRLNWKVQCASLYTPGAENDFTCFTGLSYPGLTISEFHYSPIGGNNYEFIEITNYSNTILNLEDVAFSDGISYVFDSHFLPGASAAPFNTVVLARDSTTYHNTYSKAPHGVYTGGLSSAGERVAIQDLFGTLIDEVTYGVVSPWDPTPNQGIKSLALIDGSLDNSLAQSWCTQDIDLSPGGVNTFSDSDNDSIIDCLDQCPGQPDSNIGAACDDGDPCTIGETYDTVCSCTGGIVVDTDGDGVCDAFDKCAGFDDTVDLNNNGIPDGCEECPDEVTEMNHPIINADTSANLRIMTNGIVQVGNTIEYYAGESVELLPDFEVEIGAVFHGYISPCN